MKRVLMAAAACCALSVHAGDFVYFADFESALHPVAGSVIVSEVMASPNDVGDSLGEWFELGNISAQSVDLEGCVVASGASQSTLPAHTLAAAAFAVAARSTDTSVNGGVAAFAVFAFGLGASGTLDLICGDRLIDSAPWDGSVAGQSFSLDPQHFDSSQNDVAANWCFSTQLYGTTDRGTPGSANEICPAM